MKTFFSPRNQLRVIISSIAGTSMMTLYSYLVSWQKDKNFKEPKLLGMLAQRVTPGINQKNSGAAGWGMHYLTGLLFAETYARYWSAHTQSLNIKTGLVLGGLSGIAAILIWKFTLEAHPFPPAIDFTRFAGQLFIAHIIFGLFAGIGYSLAGRKAVSNSPDRCKILIQGFLFAAYSMH